MRLDLYQAETVRIASEHTVLLNEVRERLVSGQFLSKLEQNGVLHSLQVLIENAIGKAKQILKTLNEAVPVSAYDAFDALVRCRQITASDREQWNAVIGLRNRIVHDYMNIDIKLINQWIIETRYQFVSDFLIKPILTL
jgi:uncharacterized protein YutE (UPF0331/DUF86 family)